MGSGCCGGGGGGGNDDDDDDLDVLQQAAFLN